MKFSAVAACLLCATPVCADDCANTIAALYDDGGAMDPFSRVPHVQTVSRFDSEGVSKERHEISFAYDPALTVPRP